MKKYAKNILILAILITTAFLLQNCQKEMEQRSKEQTQNKRPPNFSLRTRSFYTISSEKKFRDAFLYIKNKKGLKQTTMEDQYGFTMDTTTIKEVTYDDYISYTLRIDRLNNNNNNTEFVFENLLIEIDSTNKPTASIISYYPTEDWISAINQGQTINYDGEIFKEDIVYDISQKTHIIEDCYIYITTETQCPCAGHWPGQYCTCGTSPSSSTQRYNICDTNSGGSGSTGESSNSSSNTNDNNGGQTAGSNGSNSSNPTVTGTVFGGLSPYVLLANALNMDIQDIVNLDGNMISESEANNILSFLEQNPEEQGFSEEAYNAYLHDAKVHFNERVILDPSFANHPKAKCAYNKLLETGGIRSVLQGYFEEEQTVNLIFKVVPAFSANCSNISHGCAIFNPNTNTTTIELEEDFLEQFQWENQGGIHNTPMLHLCKVLIHEAIHANFFLALIQLGNNSLPNDSDFETLYEKYRENRNWQHEMMANHYINTITEELKDVHSLLDDDIFIEYYETTSWWGVFYNNLAWAGLTNTTAGEIYINNPTNADNYSLCNNAMAANSNETPNCD